MLDGSYGHNGASGAVGGASLQTSANFSAAGESSQQHQWHRRSNVAGSSSSPSIAAARNASNVDILAPDSERQAARQLVSKQSLNPNLIEYN